MSTKRLWDILKKPVLKVMLLCVATFTLSSCWLFDDPYEIPDDPYVDPNPQSYEDRVVHEDVEETPTFASGESAGYEDFGYYPVYDFKGTGNFTDIDAGPWKKAGYDPKDFVGVWYEDGITNGYYFEIYGDGTWQLFADTIVKGYYEVMENGIINFIEGRYGVDFGQAVPYESDEFDGWIMALTLYSESLVNLRTPTNPIKFQRTKDSAYIEDLDAFYRAEYPFMDYQGTWYPVDEPGAINFYEILGSGNWGKETDGQGMLEVGILEKVEDGKFTSTGANWGEEYLFEYPGDGYMYINGEPFEKRESEDVRYRYIVDDWLYYDDQNDCYTGSGYKFGDDLTFTSLPGNDIEEHGTYFFQDDNLLLYDDNGHQLHIFHQDIFAANDKMMDDDHFENLYGQGPKPIFDALQKKFSDD